MKKIDEASSKEFASIVAAESVQLFIKRAKSSKDDSGVFSTVISSDDEDRQGESVSQEGLDFTNYMKNPVVLWGHDYYSLPIGVCLSVEKSGNQTTAKFKFAPAEANPFAAQCQALWELGIQRAVSIGFIPRSFDDAGNTLTAEVLEFSLVPIPANPVALNTELVRQNNLDLALIASKGIGFTFETSTVVDKSVVPYADHGTADEGTAWDAGKEVKAAGDDLAKLKAMCAWYDSSEDDKKSAYKLPHHEAEGLKAVWNGVKAAMGAVAGARGGVSIPDGDRKGVISHLAKHYKAFGKDVPDMEKILQIFDLSTTNPVKAQTMAIKEKFDVEFKGAEPGASCQLDDGTPGVLARDPGDPDGPLICVPTENASAKEAAKPSDDGDEDESTSNQQAQDLQRSLEQTLEKEHATHGAKTTKAIDAFHKSIEEFHDSSDEAEPDEKAAMPKEAQECTKAMHDGTDEEHDRHETKVGKAIDTFTKGIQEWHDSSDAEPDEKAAKPSDDEGEDDEDEGAGKPSTPTDIVKAAEALKSDVSDEHDLHRKSMHRMVDEYGAKMVNSGDVDVRDKHRKAFHKAADAEHDRHEKAVQAAIDEFRTSAQVKPGEKSVSAKMSRSAKASISEAAKHLKAATALHEEIADRHHEAKGHIKAASTALSDLQSGRGNDNDEDGGSPEGDDAAPSKTQRSSSSKGSTEELDDFIQVRKLTRGVSTAAIAALTALNEKISARKSQV